MHIHSIRRKHHHGQGGKVLGFCAHGERANVGSASRVVMGAGEYVSACRF